MTDLLNTLYEKDVLYVTKNTKNYIYIFTVLFYDIYSQLYMVDRIIDVMSNLNTELKKSIAEKNI